MFQSPPTNASCASATLDRADAHEQDVEQNAPGRGGPARTRIVRLGLARPLSLADVYELWHGSWETALSATQSRTLSTNEAAAHKTVIAAERELVTNQFTLLLGQRQTRRGARDDVSFVAAEQA